MSDVKRKKKEKKMKCNAVDWFEDRKLMCKNGQTLELYEICKKKNSIEVKVFKFFFRKKNIFNIKLLLSLFSFFLSFFFS